MRHVKILHQLIRSAKFSNIRCAGIGAKLSDKSPNANRFTINCFIDNGLLVVYNSITYLIDLFQIMTSNKFIFKIAFRYFRAKKNEKFVSFISWVSLFGITIGVAALITVMSVMNGFHRELTRNIIGINGDITIISANEVISDYDELKTKLLKLPTISRLTPTIYAQVLARGNRTSTGVLVKAIDLSDLKYKKDLISNVTSGNLMDFTGKNIIAIGNELAYNLGVFVGDKVRLISSNSISTTFGTMPRSKDFTIIAIFTSGKYDYDSMTILMPLSAAQVFLSLGDDINAIEVYSSDYLKADIIASDIQKILGSDFRVTSWQKSNLQLLNALAIERVAMLVILSLIIIVAAFNIVSTLFMLVKDKTSDIAILKTIGVSNRQIMMIFICNGMLVGTIGTLSGIILGTSISYNISTIKDFLEKISGVKIFEAAIYFLYSLPSDVQINDIIFTGLISLILCFSATIYPAYKASQLNPVELLRYE